jgi:hypothetical protein
MYRTVVVVCFPPETEFHFYHFNKFFPAPAAASHVKYLTQRQNLHKIPVLELLDAQISEIKHLK